MDKVDIAATFSPEEWALVRSAPLLSGFAMLTPLLAAELAPDSNSAIGVGLYPMMMFFGTPILGQLSDRVGRKLVLLVCAGGILLSYATLREASALGSVILVMMGRALGGTTAASQPISLAALVDVSAPEKRDFWLSMGLLASSVGFAVGPALSDCSPTVKLFRGSAHRLRSLSPSPLARSISCSWRSFSASQANEPPRRNGRRSLC